MLQGNKKQHFSIRKLTIGAASVLIGVSMFALGNKANAAAGEIPVKGVAHLNVIKKHPNWKINMLNGEGKYTNKYIKTNLNWKVFAKATINGETMYRLGSDSQWVPAKYLTFNGKAAASEVKEPKTLADNVVYAPVINHNSNWKIALLNDKGQYTGNYIPTNSTWKVFAAKNINGRTMYRLGTNDQWVPADFVTGNVTFSVEEAKKDDTKSVENQKPTENKNTNNNSSSSTVTTSSDNTGSTTTTPSRELATKEDKDKLKREINETVHDFKNFAYYGNATNASKQKFDNMISKATNLLNDKNATHAEISPLIDVFNSLYIQAEKVLDGTFTPLKGTDAAKNPAKYPATLTPVVDYNSSLFKGTPWSDASIQELTAAVKKANPAAKSVEVGPRDNNEINNFKKVMNVTLVYPDGSMNVLSDKTKLVTPRNGETYASKIKANGGLKAAAQPTKNPKQVWDVIMQANPSLKNLVYSISNPKFSKNNTIRISLVDGSTINVPASDFYVRG